MAIKTDTAAVEAPPLSMLCILKPPELVDDTEYYVRLGPAGQRRAIARGDHVDPGCPVVSAFPANFAPSGERVDAVVLAVPPEAEIARRQAELTRRAPAHARQVLPVCLHCGAEAEQAVTVTDVPQATDLISALSALDDTDRRGRAAIEARFATAARAAQAQADELAMAEATFRTNHTQCPDDVESMDEPFVPDDVAMYYRRSEIRTAR
jgi:hypothetical protein